MDAISCTLVLATFFILLLLVVMMSQLLAICTMYYVAINCNSRIGDSFISSQILSSLMANVRHCRMLTLWSRAPHRTVGDRLFHGFIRYLIISCLPSIARCREQGKYMWGCYSGLRLQDCEIVFQTCISQLLIPRNKRTRN